MGRRRRFYLISWLKYDIWNIIDVSIISIMMRMWRHYRYTTPCHRGVSFIIIKNKWNGISIAISVISTPKKHAIMLSSWFVKDATYLLLASTARVIDVKHYWWAYCMPFVTTIYWCRTKFHDMTIYLRRHDIAMKTTYHLVWIISPCRYRNKWRLTSIYSLKCRTLQAANIDSQGTHTWRRAHALPAGRRVSAAMLL